MTYSFRMENHEPFQDLSGDLLSVPHSNLPALDILIQVSVFDVLHREKYVCLVFIPAKELDEQMSMLYVEFRQLSENRG